MRDFAPVLPSEFRVVFPGRRCAGSPADACPEEYVATVSLADAGWPNVAGTPGALTLRSTACALYSAHGGAPPANQAALDALARRLATDTAAYRTESFDEAWFGVAAPEPTALHDLIAWEYTGECVTTRVRSGDFFSEPEEYSHQDPAVAGCVDDPGGAFVTAKTPAVAFFAPGGTRVAWVRRLLTLERGRLFDPFSRIDQVVNCCAGYSLNVLIFGCTGACALPPTTFELKDEDGNVLDTKYAGTANCVTVPNPGGGVLYCVCNVGATFEGITTPGRYRVTFTPESGWHYTGGTLTVDLTQCGLTSIQGGFGNEAGYECQPDLCCPLAEQQIGSHWPPYKVLHWPASSITINDGLGDITLNLSGGVLVGCADRTASAFLNCDPGDIGADQTVKVYWQIACGVGQVSVASCSPFGFLNSYPLAGGPCPPGGFPGRDVSAVTVSVSSCRPFTGTGTFETGRDVPGFGWTETALSRIYGRFGNITLRA